MVAGDSSTQTCMAEAAARCSSAPRPDLAVVWRDLEALRASYARAETRPKETFDAVRAALVAIDAEALLDQHPDAAGIIECALFELRRWEETWPTIPGRIPPPSTFGVLIVGGLP